MSEPPVAYKDRSTGLLLFGLLELLMALSWLGTLALGAAGAATLAAMPGGSPQQTRALLPGLSLYLLLAVLFASLGMGSILQRRWARPLALVVSWLWLAFGVLAVFVCVAVMPDLFRRLAQMEGNAQAAEVMGPLQGCMIAAMVVFGVLLPAGMIAFYRSRHVKATLEARDPVPRWTDRCPLPVLGLSLFLAYTSFACLMGAGFGMLPAFGQMVSGAPAILLMVVIAGMLAVLSRATYKLEPWSWWAVLGFWVLWTLSGVSFAMGRFEWRSMYERMGTPASELQQMEQMGIFEMLEGPWIKVLVAAWVLATLAYLLAVRRYFRPPQEPAPLP